MIGRAALCLAGGLGLSGMVLRAWVVTAPATDWNLAGPFGGTARSIALDPQRPETVLAGGFNSLLFRSKDAGQNWEMLYLPKRALSEVTSIMVDPADSNHYLAGVIASQGGGLFDSHDEGRSWEVVKDLSKFGVRAVAAAPSKPSEFVAGTQQGVWLSENSGKDWKRVSDPENLEMQGITVVVIDSQNPDIIYAGTSHLPWKSIDRGKTWQSIHTGMIDDSDVFSIFVEPSNPSFILASACSGIYSSDSRGDQWKKLMGIPNTSRRTHVIREDPANPSTIYAGTTTGLYKSLNRGATWKSLSDTQANAIAFDPTHPGTMYMALEYEGIGKSEDGGETIKLLNHGFVDRSISSVTRAGDKLVALETQAGETSGLFVSPDRGETWTRQNNVRGLGGVHLKAIAGMPKQANVWLGATPHHIYKTVDGGNLWKPMLVKVMEPPKPEPQKAAPVSRTRRRRPVRPAKPIVKIRQVNLSEVSALYAMKSGESELVFAATDLGLLKSTDAGERWTMASLPGSPAVYALYSSSDPRGRLVARAASGLFLSKDCGEHWEELHFPQPVSDVNEIAVAPGGGSSLLAATRVGLFSSTDDGANWSSKMNGLPGSTFSSVIFGGAPTSAYAVEYGQLWQTDDSGANWRKAQTVIPSLRIRRLWQPEAASSRIYGITSDLGILFREGGVIR